MPNWMDNTQIYMVFSCLAFVVIIPILAHSEAKKREAKLKAKKMAENGHRWIHNL